MAGASDGSERAGLAMRPPPRGSGPAIGDRILFADARGSSEGSNGSSPKRYGKTQDKASTCSAASESL